MCCFDLTNIFLILNRRNKNYESHKLLLHLIKPRKKSVEILRVQKVISKRSAGACTRCTRSNAFPACEQYSLYSEKLSNVVYFEVYFNEVVDLLSATSMYASKYKEDKDRSVK